MRLDCSGMEFEKLADLLEQGQFELLNLPVGDERKKPSDIRLVYMMNDTAESFLVFHEAVLTGNYLPDYEGELSASLDKEETDNTDAEGEEPICTITPVTLLRRTSQPSLPDVAGKLLMDDRLSSRCPARIAYFRSLPHGDANNGFS